MHPEILTKKQEELLPLIKQFSNKFYLVGGTAIALQLGHRRSIDFDLFTAKKFNSRIIRDQIRQKYKIDNILVERSGELTLISNAVKLTFYRYPFKISYPKQFKKIIYLPSLLTLSAMKAFALGRRAKWKDYVDLYFIFKKYSLQEVVRESKKIFGQEFNERLFRIQLAYYKDINYSEKVKYLPGFKTSNSQIKEKLRSLSLQE